MLSAVYSVYYVWCTHFILHTHYGIRMNASLVNWGLVLTRPELHFLVTIGDGHNSGGFNPSSPAIITLIERSCFLCLLLYLFTSLFNTVKTWVSDELKKHNWDVNNASNFVHLFIRGVSSNLRQQKYTHSRQRVHKALTDRLTLHCTEPYTRLSLLAYTFLHQPSCYDDKWSL